MFTGIIQRALPIERIETQPGLNKLWLTLPNDMADNLQMGASVALNGTCLTIAEITDTTVGFDVMQQTLTLTNLADLQPGDLVNVERAARFGDEIGGHVLSGHIHCQAKLVDKQTPENNCRLEFEVPDAWLKYVFEKGYIAVDGASLTIAEVNGNRFSVYLIPETLRITRFDSLQPGDSVNIEVDSHTQAIVDTLERMREAGRLG